MKENENCTYLFNKDTRELYISLSFEDLTNLEECEDYMIVNVDDYFNNNSVIMELIKDVLSEEI